MKICPNCVQEQQTEAQPAKKHLDFLDILLTAKDESGHGLTDTDIRDEVDTFLFAGTFKVADNGNFRHNLVYPVFFFYFFSLSLFDNTGRPVVTMNSAVICRPPLVPYCLLSSVVGSVQLSSFCC